MRTSSIGIIVALFVGGMGVSACSTLPSTSSSQPSPLSSSGLSSSGFPLTTPTTNPFEQEDLEWYYKTVFGEVRNQADHEVRAVCQVIYNRLQSGEWGTSFKEVVLAPYQFSVWNRKGGQRRYLLGENVTQHTEYERVKSICNSVVFERLNGVDTSRGINYFYHPQGMVPKCVKYKKFGKKKRKFRCTRWRKLPPRWAYNYHHRERIGAGVFFRKAH